VTDCKLQSNYPSEVRDLEKFRVSGINANSADVGVPSRMTDFRRSIGSKQATSIARL